MDRHLFKMHGKSFQKGYRRGWEKGKRFLAKWVEHLVLGNRLFLEIEGAQGASMKVREVKLSRGIEGEFILAMSK